MTTHVDFERIAQARYASLEGKVVAGWKSDREAAFAALLAVVGGTADGHPAADVLDYSDASWAAAERLIAGTIEPANQAERDALARYQKAVS
jgi:hypothetical protein